MSARLLKCGHVNVNIFYSAALLLLCAVVCVAALPVVQGLRQSS